LEPAKSNRQPTVLSVSVLVQSADDHQLLFHVVGPGLPSQHCETSDHMRQPTTDVLGQLELETWGRCTFWLFIYYTLRSAQPLVSCQVIDRPISTYRARPAEPALIIGQSATWKDISAATESRWSYRN